MAFHSPTWDRTDFPSNLQYEASMSSSTRLSSSLLPFWWRAEMRFKEPCRRLQVIPSRLGEARRFSP